MRWQASVSHLFRRAVGLRARVKVLSGGGVPLGHLPGSRNLGERHEVRGQAPFLLTLFWRVGLGPRDQHSLRVGWPSASASGPCACLLGQPHFLPASLAPVSPALRLPLTLAPLPPQGRRPSSPHPRAPVACPPRPPPGPHLSFLQPRVKGKESIREFDRIQLHSCR